MAWVPVIALIIFLVGLGFVVVEATTRSKE